MKQSNLLIIFPKHGFLFNAIYDAGYNVLDPYIGNMFFLRIIRELWFRSNFPFKSIWFNKNITDNYEKILIYSPLIILDFIKWIRGKNRKSKIVLFYSNLVSASIKPEKIADDLCEKWSADPEDCAQYGLHLIKYGGYPKELKIEKKQPKYDIFYIGRDKGRITKLYALKECFDKMDLCTYFHITAERRFKKFSNSIYKPLIPYAQVLSIIGESKAILHLVDGGQTSVTVRVVESLLHQVKLITNNPNIVEYDFYFPENIFILGKDDLNNLKDFLNSPYKEVDQSFLEKYYLHNFIKTILYNNEIN